MARLTSDLILSLHDRVTGPAKGVGRSLDTLERKVAAAGRSGRRNGKLTAAAVSAMGKAETSIIAASARAAALPAAAIYGGTQAYLQYADVERQLTRTGLKLGASRETMRAIRGDMEAIADRYAVPIAEVMASFDSLAESGFELADARSSLDGMVKATQGLGGSGADTVATYDAARKSIKLAASEQEQFFDIIAAGGSMGKFEGSDLARYLPSLLPVVARQGYEGLDGAARLVGFLEVMRDFVGSSEEAATATADMFEKISSPDVMENFLEVGINLEKELKKARDGGKDVLEVMHDLINKATKGDATKLSELFGDRDSRRAANVLLTQMDAVRNAQRTLRNESGGTIVTNVKVVVDDAQAQIDRLSNSWDAFVKNVGAGVSIGASPALEAINADIERDRAYRAGITKEEERGGSKSESFEEYKRRFFEANPDKKDWRGGFNKELNDSFYRDMAAYGRGETKGPYDRLEQNRQRGRSSRFPSRSDAQAASDALRERQARNLDGEQVRRGIPTPSARKAAVDAAMTDAERLARNLDGERVSRGVPLPASRDGGATSRPAPQDTQRGEYDRGRRQGERAARERAKTMSGREALDGIVGRLEASIAKDEREGKARKSSEASAKQAEQKRQSAEAGGQAATLQHQLDGLQDRRRTSGRSFTPMLDSRISIFERRLADAEARAAPAEPRAGLGPTASPTAPSGPSAREAESQSMKALVAQFGAILARSGGFQPGADVRDEAGIAPVAKPVIDAPLRQEGAAAQSTAEQIAMAIQTALSITATPVVDPTSIQAAGRAADALIAKLRSIPGLAAQANSSVGKSVAGDLGRQTSAALRNHFSDGGT